MRAKPGQRCSKAAGVTGVYVVCLDCGQELPYSWDEMKVVSPFEQNEASPQDDVPDLSAKIAEKLRLWR